MTGLQTHVQELRRRLAIVAVFLTLATITVFYYSGDILAFVQSDLGFTLHALKAYEVFYTQIMLSVLIGFIATLPIAIYQALKFAEPGLTRREYTTLRNYMPFAIILFVGGAVFAYEFVVKASLNFFFAFSTESTVDAVWGLQNTVGFALKLSAFTGIFFQLPIVASIMAKIGLLNSEKMIRYRKHFFISVLIIAALTTPPDIISQVLITVPVLVLYQLSIYLVKRINE